MYTYRDHLAVINVFASATPKQPLSVVLRLQGRKNHCVAVIGDGAITGGMAYEAMNHAGFLDKNMIVILNDNQQVLYFFCYFSP